MKENLRVLFSIIWLLSCGAILASAIAFIITWGDYGSFLIGSVVAWCIATAGTVITSLN